MALAFDASFYLSQNPDVAAAISRGTIQSAEQHYNDFGRFESRNPNAFFNTAFYLAQYPDVASARVNPFQHFLANGAAEGRLTNATEKAAIDLNGNGSAGDDFNAAKYVADYPDVGTAIANGTLKSAYQHFVVFGQFEGRTATLSNGTTVTGPITNSGTIPGTVAPQVLTTGADNIVGTAGNDIFNGFVAATTAAGNSTLTGADVINGGAGIDTLNITVDGNAAGSLPGATITNVEIFNIREVGGTAGSYDFSTVAGEQQVWSDRSTDAVTFQSVGSSSTAGSAATIGLRGDGTTVLGSVSFSTATLSDKVSIAIDGGVGAAGTAPAITNTGAQTATTATISSTGAANTVGVVDLGTGAVLTGLTINAATGLTASLAAGDFAANATLTVTGAGAVNLSGAALSANITTIDASGSTGGVNVLEGASATKFTGGTGADRVAFGANFTSADTVDAGAGRDTVALDGIDFTSTTAANADALKGLNALANVEVIEFTGAGAAVISGGTAATSFTNGTVDQLIFNTTGGGVDTVELAGARLYSFGTENTGDATFNSAIGQNTLNLSLIGGTTATGGTADVGVVTANGATTINIASTGSQTAANTITTLTAAANATVNITGSHSVTIGSSTNGIVLDGSTATGVLNITGSTSADIIRGGSANDIIRGGVGADVVTGGAGNDTFVFNTGDAVVTAIDTITDLNLGTGAQAGRVDILSFQNAGGTAATVVTLTATQQSTVTTAASFAAAVDAVAAVATADGATTQFTYGSDTYIFHSGAAGSSAFDAAADHIVKVTGVVGTLDAADIATFN